MKPEFSIVMPAFNEAEGLQSTVDSVTEALGDESAEIIVVDDGSSDETWRVVDELSRAIPAVRGLRFSRNFGHQPALLAGLSAARGDAVITLDSDGQHPPDLIGEMIARWRAGAAIVQGLRQDGAETGSAKSGSSKGFYRLFSWLAGTQIPAGSADYRLLDRAAVDVIIDNPRSASFLRGFVPWTGFETSYLPFAPRERTAGATKYSLGKMLSLAREGIMRFSVKPLRLATFLGSLTCAAAIGYLAYVLVIRLATDDHVAGWASLAGLVALLGGLQLLILGIIGEYLGMVFETLQGRPPYIVAETTAAAAQSEQDPT